MKESRRAFLKLIAAVGLAGVSQSMRQVLRHSLQEATFRGKLPNAGSSLFTK